jgi:hypothetical protein
VDAAVGATPNFNGRSGKAGVRPFKTFRMQCRGFDFGGVRGPPSVAFRLRRCLIGLAHAPHAAGSRGRAEEALAWTRVVMARLRRRERISLVKNRMREFRTSGSVVRRLPALPPVERVVSDSCSLPSATESMKPFLRCTALSASGLPSRMTTLPTGPRADFDALSDRLGDRRDHRLPRLHPSHAAEALQSLIGFPDGL